jgi:hypothetical protein
MHFLEIDGIQPNHIFLADRSNLINLYKSWGENIQLYHDMQMQMIYATLWKADKIFKVIKLVFGGGSSLGEQAWSFNSIYTEMNDKWNQIVSQFLTRTADKREVKKVLEGIKKRFELHGFPDNYCHKYSMLVKHFPELADEGPLPSAINSTGLAKFDFDNTFPQHLVRVLSTISEIKKLTGNLSTIFNQARQEGKVLDI